MKYLKIIVISSVSSVKSTYTRLLNRAYLEILVNRFVRGDKSRHESGSGLGLAIAKSFVEAQGGTFNIAIDGDN